MSRLLYLLSFLLLINIAFAQEMNPKAVTEMTVKITQSGSITTIGTVSYVNISLYIPQDAQIIVTGAEWKYTYDEFDNRLLLLEWNNPGYEEYKVESIVKNTAKYLLNEKGIGSDPRFLEETDQIVIDDDIRELAYPYEKSLKGVSELTIFVNELVEYDKSVFGDQKPSDWVLKNKRGVCLEHSNLLTALLRSKGIPTRYISGYAYSKIDNKFVGHAWVEVLLDNGEWIAFDPTWLEGGYLDATHIKTAHLLDGNQQNILMYRGSGDVDWEKEDDNFEILDYESSNITEIELASEDFPVNGYGYIRADLSSSCLIEDIDARSCIGKEGEILNIYDQDREQWFCKNDYIYWFFSTDLSPRYRYTCPTIVYDQLDSYKNIDIVLSTERFVPPVSISGPDTVGINEQFVLIAGVNNDFIFYSPDFGKNDEKTWQLSINKPGNYKFYLYSNNDLAIKEVEVKEEKEFDLTVTAKDNITLGNSFLVDVKIKNLAAKAKQAKIRIDFEDQKEEDISFLPDEEKNLSFNLTANSLGMKKIIVSAMSDSLTSYSTYILVYEEKTWSQSLIDSIISFFASILNWFSSALASLLGSS